MAVVQFGGTVVGLRGTIGGITFSENGSAAYAKAWARPPAMNAAKQTLQRIRMVDASTGWQALNAGEKTDWNNFAAAPNEIDYDGFGAQRFLSGFQWYCRCVTRRASVGLAASNTPPSGAAATAVTGFSVTMVGSGGGGSTADWDGSQWAVDDSCVIVMAFSPRVGGSDCWVNWKQILAKYQPGDTQESVDSEYRAAFGDLPSGWRCWARIYKQALAGNRSVAASSTVLLG